MFPWSAIISLAGQAASGVMSAVNNDKMEQERRAEAARREAHYEAQAAENPLSRADNQALLNQYDRSARQQVETARNVGKITGATPEYGVAVQGKVAEGRANLMGQMSANNQARVDASRERAERARQAEADASIAAKAARNQTYANLAANAANAAGAIADAYQAPASDRQSIAPITTPKQGVTVSAAPAPNAATILDNGMAELKERLLRNQKMGS